TKRRIRRAEELLLTAEKFSAIATGYGRPYPREELQAAWKNLLFDHFHDIMPGSGIAVNYLDAKRNLEDVSRAASQILRAALDEILAHAKTNGPGIPIAVFNSLSWARSEVIEVNVQTPAAAPNVGLVNAQGRPAPSRMISMDPSTHIARLLLRAS